MTPRDQLMSWHETKDKRAFCERARQLRFEVAPVIDVDSISGALTVASEEVEPLTQRWLVSHDIGVRSLLALFASSGRLSLFVFHCQEVVGLVTPADLNKLPSRVYYHHIGALEMALGAWVRACFENCATDIFPLPSRRRRDQLSEQQQTLVEDNVDLEIIERLYLCDLINIVRRQEELRPDLGFSSRTATKRATNGINRLRNRTMHPVRPLIESVLNDMTRLHRRAARARDLLDKVQQSM